MKKLLAMLLALVMVVGVFAACEKKEETDDTTKNSVPVASVPSESTPEVSIDPNVRVYTVHVVDEEGNPMSNVMINFCDDIGCMPSFTDEEGVAEATVASDKYAYIGEMPEGYEYATSQDKWTFEESNEATIVLRVVEIEPPEDIEEPTEEIVDEIPEEAVE